MSFAQLKIRDNNFFCRKLSDDCRVIAKTQFAAVQFLPESFILKTQLSRGFSLIEVLIASFILAFGILSVASLQIASLQSSQDSALQTVATNQVDNILAQIASGDLDCAAWKTQCEALLPQAEAKCNRKSVSLCWVGKKATKQCITQSIA